MFDARVGDAQLRAGDRGESDERRDFDVVGTDAMARAPERATFTTRACGKAAARRPAVDSAGSAPTPKAVLSPATTMVLRHCSGED